MVRFLGIAPLLLISHIALVVAAAGVPYLGNSDNVMDIVARSCKSCAQRSARIIRAVPQETFVAHGPHPGCPNGQVCSHSIAGCNPKS
ncbi:hypothetical protein SCLCIDRAFT_1216516 [Scleroderma citrinum Foug A]|uniref:Uncharacterized protein n=1 Tax=Scleroderma citrinum Foug A TaxID=1036808 RepID=A0A0C2ZGL1_9AGAM|nr:hypothetical protein SCLCIDRAFT_1216516 [Scleroderma citrinum Foug A]